jgi:threonine/homoserine/homoserine lactone efflux protein
MYLVSRTIVQGRSAGFASLAGTSTGSGLHVLAAALGLSALLVAVPIAFEATRLLGAVYLGWLAYATWRSSDAENLPSAPSAPRARLFRQGFFTGVLNPKVAAFQLALFPQFVSPTGGHVLRQSLLLGATQLVIALIGDSFYVLVASAGRATAARWVAEHRGWARAPRRALASVFALLALRLAWDRGPAR